MKKKKLIKMKKTLMVSLLVAAGFVAVGNAATVDLVPIPRPVKFKGDMNRPVEFDATAKVVVECPDAAAAGWLDAHFAAWFAESAPRAVAGETGLDLREGDEAYAAKADGAGVKIRARTLVGVRWAAYSIRQLAIAKRGTFRTEGRILPSFEMSDSPLLGFRCVHLCWLPEMREAQIERAIRLAALMKFNYVILESWGTYRSAKHPWWGWPNGKMTKEVVARLVALGKDLGVTLIPQINVFGHASVARACSLKNAILDLQPEYEPLFEPGGWNWCLTNPEAQRVLRELIVEMHENFGNPPYFHLGCDEAQPPSCPECRKVSYGKLVCQHIGDLAKFVADRGAKAMIWHDMLLKRYDPRWRGFFAFGDADTITLVDSLPKDVVICDWQYSNHIDPNTKRPIVDWPTFLYFKEKGFPVAACPSENYQAMKPMADCIAKIGGFGYIQTTWQHLHGNDWVQKYRMGSSAAWGTSPVPNAPQYDTAFGTALRLVGHDMKLTDPLDTGHSNYQIPPSWWIDN